MDLLTIDRLSVAFPLRSKSVTAIDGLSLEVRRGEIVGVIGESGAGKSTIGRALVSLIDPPGHVSGGRIFLDGRDLLAEPEQARALIRGRRVGYIFQNPLTSLNPVLSIGDQLIEALQTLRGLSASDARAQAIELLRRVEIPDPEARLGQFPHQLSGGQRQRVVVAIAISGKPDLIIADEPTTALDVTIQAAVLKLIQRLCAEENIACLLITHDMGVIAEIADRVYVMLNGRLVEHGTTAEIIGRPREAYTRNLIAAIPPLQRRLHRLPVPNEGSRLGSPDLDAAMRYLREGRTAPKASATPLVSVRHLSKVFRRDTSLLGRSALEVRALDDVSLDVMEGETVGIVGESGSGKSTIGRILLGLLEPTSGSIHYRGVDLHAPVSRKERVRRRLDLQIVFQDPASSLDPRMQIRHSIGNAMRLHGLEPDRRKREAIVRGLLERVGLPPSAADCYPHQFSGGQLQRIGIARALSTRPQFIFCDEPTSALDVSIQAQVLNLLKDLQEEFALTLLFVSHDLCVIRQMCDRVVVMRNGRICELGDNAQVFERPAHPYTRDLLQAMPTADRLLAG